MSCLRLLFLLMLSCALLTPEVEASGLTLRLRSSTTSYDPNTAANGDFIIELSSQTPTTVTWTEARLHGTHHGFPMAMYKGDRRKVESVARTIRLPAGESVALLRIPMSEALLQGGNASTSQARWGWSGSPPRGAPSASPVHGTARGTLGWEMVLAAKGTFWAEAVVDGRRLRSEEHIVPVMPPAVEEIETIVRFTTARYLPPAREEIEALFTPQSFQRGRLQANECRIVLPEGGGQHLLRALSAKQAGGMYEYRCDPRPVRLFLARWRTPDPPGGSRIVLRRYESATSTPLP